MSDFRLARLISISFFAKLLLQALSFAFSYYIVFKIGEAERGAYFLLVTTSQVLVQFFNFGLHSSNTYFASKNPRLSGKLTLNSFCFALALSICSYLFFLGGGGSLMSIKIDEATIVFFNGLLGTLYIYQSGLLVGLKAYGWVNLVDVVFRALTILITYIYLNVTSGSHHGIFLINTLIALLSLVVLMSNRPYVDLGFDLGLFKKSIHFGFKSYLSCFFSFFILKSDIIMLGFFMDLNTVGEYSLAVTVVDAQLALVAIASQVLFSEISSAGEEDGVLILKKYSKYVLGYLLVSSIALSVSHPFIFKFIFKSGSFGFGNFLNVLLSASVFSGLNMLFMNFLGAKGMPGEVVYVPLFGCALNIALNYFLINEYGALGASFSTLISSLVILMLLVFFTWVRIVKKT